MYFCYNCDKQITSQSKSIEHIIPNSIGGRIKSSKILCIDCNTLFGDTIDRDLAKSYGSIVSLLGIKRDRTRDYTIKNLKSESGELFHLVDGYTPTPSKPTIAITDKNLFISARDKKQLEQIIQGQQRKYPDLEMGDLANAKVAKDEYLKEKLTIPMSFGGDTNFRAIAKIAINYLKYYEHNFSGVERLITVMNGSRKNDFDIHHYPLIEHFHENNNEVLHVIHIKGDATNKSLYAYIVLFSFSSFIVNIDENYSEESFEKTYSYDVIRNKELSKTIQLNYAGKTSYKQQFENEKELHHQKNIYSLKTNLARIAYIIDNIHAERSRDKILAECMDEIQKKHPGSIHFTQQMMSDFIELVAYRMSILIDHIHNKGHR